MLKNYYGNLQTGLTNIRTIAFGKGAVTKLALALIVLVGLGISSVSHLHAAEFKQVPIKGPKNATEQYSGVSYGPIDDDDTLWRIADRYRQNKNLSIYQVMVAIQELNPDAFYSDNLNHMKDGVTLMLPSERYIARINPEDAKLKSDQDDDAWESNVAPGSSLKNLKPPEKLASRTDLSQTKDELETKLNQIDAEQQKQFEAIRQQFADSIDSVQTLLNENKKIYERLDTVNKDIEDLRGRIGNDGEVQRQMDQILALQNELVANARKSAQNESSKGSMLDFVKEPAFLIGITVLFSISLLAGLAFWLLKRQNKEPTSEMNFTETSAAEVGELDDISDVLSEDLKGEKADELGNDDLFGDDDLLDDVLAEELDESLDDVLENELGSYSDLDDDMLVPEDLEKQDDLEQMFDSDTLDDVLDEDDLLAGALDMDDQQDDGIEITESEDASDLDKELDGVTEELDEDLFDTGAEVEINPESDNIEEIIEEDIADLGVPEVPDVVEESPEQVEEVEPEALAEPEPEIEAEPEVEQEPQSAKPEVFDPADELGITDEPVLSEDAIEKVSEKLGEQNRKLNDLTRQLTRELKDAPAKAAGDPDIAIDVPEPVFGDVQEPSSPEASEEPEEFSGELTNEMLAAMGMADEPAETSEVSQSETPQSESIEEVSDESEPVQDDLADELLAEFGIEGEGEQQPEAEDESVQNDLADELLAEMGGTDEEESASDEPESQVEEEHAQDDLADELLAEFGIDEEEASEEPEPQVEEEHAQDDLADELLAEFGIDESESAEEPETQLEVSEAEEADHAQDDLADELLAEFGIDESESAEEPETQPEVSEAEETDHAQDDLADELLAEFGIDENESADEAEELAESEQETGEVETGQDDLADELLAEFGIEDESTVSDETESEAQDEISSEVDTESGNQDADFDTVEDSQTDSDEVETASSAEDELANELLAELGMGDESSDVASDSEQPDDSSQDTDDEAEEAPEEKVYEIDSISEEDYQSLLDELDFEPETPPEPPQGDTSESEQPVEESSEFNEPDMSFDDVEVSNTGFLDEPNELSEEVLEEPSAQEEPSAEQEPSAQEETPEVEELSQEQHEAPASENTLVDELEAAAELMMEDDASELELEPDNDAETGSLDGEELELEAEVAEETAGQEETSELELEDNSDDTLAALEAQLSDADDFDADYEDDAQVGESEDEFASLQEQLSDEQSAPETIDVDEVDQLEEALKDFDDAELDSTSEEQMVEPEALSEPDESAAETEEVQSELDKELQDELDDMPGLGDWLGEEHETVANEQGADQPQDDSDIAPESVVEPGLEPVSDNTDLDNEVNLESGSSDDDLPTLDDLQFSVTDEHVESQDEESPLDDILPETSQEESEPDFDFGEFTEDSDMPDLADALTDSEDAPESVRDFTDDSGNDSDSNDEDADALEQLESTSFDDLLNSIDGPEEEPEKGEGELSAEPDIDFGQDDEGGIDIAALLNEDSSSDDSESSVQSQQEQSPESAPESVQEEPERLVLPDNPDLDLHALLNEETVEPVEDIPLEPEQSLAGEELVDEFKNVETLLAESMEAESEDAPEPELNLDVQLGEFTGVTDDEDVIDVDKDSGIGAKLDLARAYMEINDMESARQFINEVMEKGSAEEQHEAKELMELVERSQ